MRNAVLTLSAVTFGLLSACGETAPVTSVSSVVEAGAPSPACELVDGNCVGAGCCPAYTGREFDFARNCVSAPLFLRCRDGRNQNGSCGADNNAGGCYEQTLEDGGKRVILTPSYLAAGELGATFSECLPDVNEATLSWGSGECKAAP